LEANLANANAAFGLRPLRYLDGRPYTGAVEYYFATGATGVIRPGDPVVESGTTNTSEVVCTAGTFPPGTLQTCTIALPGDGDPITGSCVAVVPTNRDSLTYRETSTDRVIAVARGHDLVFEVMANTGGTALAAVDIGLFAVLAAGTTSVDTSDWTLDTAVAPTTTASFQLKLLGFSKKPKNGEIGANAVVEVLINNHTLGVIVDAGRSTAI
jgi:hypothetical protein